MYISKEKSNATHQITDLVINVETEGLDKAIIKMNELVKLLREANELIVSLLNNLADI